MKFSGDIHLVTGRYPAVDPLYGDRPEWPPHPDRFHLALIATACTLDVEEAERVRMLDALRWLEALPAPAILCGEALSSQRMGSYVPVNGRTLRMADLPALATRRSTRAQFREFLWTCPDHPLVRFIWMAEPAEFERHRDALERLLVNTTRFGQSWSMVRAGLGDGAGTPTYVSREDGEVRVRVPGPGRTDQCLDGHARHQAEGGDGARIWHPPLRPGTPYGPPGGVGDTPRSVFAGPGRWFVLALAGGPPVGGEEAPLLVNALRAAILRHGTTLAGGPLPELLSGHAPDGGPSPDDHLALVPMCNVGHAHADGRLVGFAAMLPRRVAMGSAEERMLAAALAAIEGIGLPGDGHRQWRLAVPAQAARQAGRPLRSLDPECYGAESRCWATVTPYVCDRYPDRRRVEEDVTAMVRISCRRIGLPEPELVTLSPAAFVQGGADVRRLLGLPPKYPKWRTHLRLDFGRKVAGPVLIGRARHMGMGLCRPLDMPAATRKERAVEDVHAR